MKPFDYVTFENELTNVLTDAIKAYISDDYEDNNEGETMSTYIDESGYGVDEISDANEHMYNNLDIDYIIHQAHERAIKELCK